MIQYQALSTRQSTALSVVRGRLDKLGYILRVEDHDPRRKISSSHMRYRYTRAVSDLQLMRCRESLVAVERSQLPNSTYRRCSVKRTVNHSAKVDSIFELYVVATAARCCNGCTVCRVPCFVPSVLSLVACLLFIRVSLPTRYLYFSISDMKHKGVISFLASFGRLRV